MDTSHTLLLPFVCNASYLLMFTCNSEISPIFMLCFSSHFPFQLKDPRILKGQTRIDISQLMPLDDKTHSLSIHTSHPGQTPKSQGLTFHHYVAIPLPIEALGGCLAPPVDLHRGPSYRGRSPCIALPHPEELPLVSQPIHSPLVGADAAPALLCLLRRAPFACTHTVVPFASTKTLPVAFLWL